MIVLSKRYEDWTDWNGATVRSVFVRLTCEACGEWWESRLPHSRCVSLPASQEMLVDAVRHSCPPQL